MPRRLPPDLSRRFEIHERVISEGAYALVCKVRNLDYVSAATQHAVGSRATLSVSSGAPMSARGDIRPNSRRNDQPGTNEKYYALKIVDQRPYRERGMLEQLSREVELHQRATAGRDSNKGGHSIVRLLELFDKDDRFLYMLLDWCPNGSLLNIFHAPLDWHSLAASEAQGIYASSQCYGGLPEDLSAEIWGDLVHAMTYLAERRIVHRDLTPANLLFNRRWFLKIADFGWCCEPQDATDGPFAERKKCGTVHYMAPEVVGSRPQIRCGVDVWAAGVLLHQMIAGVHPYQALIEESMSQMNGDFSQLSEALDRMDFEKKIGGALASLADPGSTKVLSETILLALQIDPSKRADAEELGRASVWLHRNYTIPRDEQKPPRPRVLVHKYGNAIQSASMAATAHLDASSSTSEELLTGGGGGGGAGSGASMSTEQDGCGVSTVVEEQDPSLQHQMGFAGMRLRTQTLAQGGRFQLGGASGTSGGNGDRGAGNFNRSDFLRRASILGTPDLRSREIQFGRAPFASSALMFNPVNDPGGASFAPGGAISSSTTASSAFGCLAGAGINNIEGGSSSSSGASSSSGVLNKKPATFPRTAITPGILPTFTAAPLPKYTAAGAATGSFNGGASNNAPGANVQAARRLSAFGISAESFCFQGLQLQLPDRSQSTMHLRQMPTLSPRGHKPAFAFQARD
ncbi:unnamed protein product [Amoebophrya sp. A25]|nr:unnamed protein product [Amoebophrya sp. A25]|eukprot:GSA25T00015904001.1